MVWSPVLTHSGKNAERISKAFPDSTWPLGHRLLRISWPCPPWRLIWRGLPRLLELQHVAGLVPQGSRNLESAHLVPFGPDLFESHYAHFGLAKRGQPLQESWLNLGSYVFWALVISCPGSWNQWAVGLSVECAENRPLVSFNRFLSSTVQLHQSASAAVAGRVCRSFWLACGVCRCCRRSPTLRQHASTAARNTQWTGRSWCPWSGTWLVSTQSGHSLRWPLASLRLVMWCLTLRRTRGTSPWIQFGCSWLPIPHWHFVSRSMTSTMPSSVECSLCHFSRSSWRPCTEMRWLPNLPPSPDSSDARSWPLLVP